MRIGSQDSLPPTGLETGKEFEMSIGRQYVGSNRTFSDLSSLSREQLAQRYKEGS